MSQPESVVSRVASRTYLAILFGDRRGQALDFDVQFGLLLALVFAATAAAGGSSMFLAVEAARQRQGGALWNVSNWNSKKHW